MTGIRGAKPVPIEIKRKLGNPGRRPLPPEGALATVGRTGAVPEPMRPLRVPGREMWERVLRAGATWINLGSDLEYLLLVCEQVDERETVRNEVLDRGVSYDRGQLRALESAITKGLASLGLTPVDRARLGNAVTPQGASSLDSMIAAREQRSSS